MIKHLQSPQKFLPLLLTSFFTLSFTLPVNADLTGDQVVGFAFRTNGGQAVFDEVETVAPATEFMNLSFGGLAYFMDIDGGEPATIKLTISNGSPDQHQSTVDIQWIAGDLQWRDEDGNVIPGTGITGIMPKPGNTLIVSEMTTMGDNAVRIRTAPGQGIPPGGMLCAEFVLVTQHHIPGDVNRDGIVNLLDVAGFVDKVTTGNYQVEADTNFDCKVDLLDVAPFVAKLVFG